MSFENGSKFTVQINYLRSYLSAQVMFILFNCDQQQIKFTFTGSKYVKSKGVVVVGHAMKKYGKVEVELHALTSVIDGGEW